MSLQTLSEWLRCPNCFLPLQPTGVLAFGCESGHSSDVNKRGYASLVTGPQKFIGDSAVMLDARDRFQSGGFYTPLRDAVARVVAAEQPRRIVDIGCGTGYYLRGVLAACDARPAVSVFGPTAVPLRALAVDLSPAAVARTVRAGVDSDGLVADVWSPLPVRDAAADVVLNIFAPRNAAEFHRVLSPGALLLVVVPHDSHLQELRAAGLAVSMQPDKARHLVDGLAAHFRLEAQERLSFTMNLSGTDVEAVLGMGPSAHHGGSQTVIEGDSATSVTAAFDIFSFRHLSL